MNESDLTDFEYFPLTDPPLHVQSTLEGIYRIKNWPDLLMEYNQLIYLCNQPGIDLQERCSTQFWASFHVREQGRKIPICNNREMNIFFTMMMASAIEDLGINQSHPNIYRYLESTLNIRTFPYQNS